MAEIGRKGFVAGKQRDGGNLGRPFLNSISIENSLRPEWHEANDKMKRL
jgi:hypothetical protein